MPSCHASEETAPLHRSESTEKPAVLVLIGHPNVGKSVIFQRLTGVYAQVSNYPGTTVEVTRATYRFDEQYRLLDTPGVLSLPSRSDDERVSVASLLQEPISAIIQVGDAKNLRRTLALTALLAELGMPMVLVLNMNDEAQARGIALDLTLLKEHLGIAIVETVATQNEGIAGLVHALKTLTHQSPAVLPHRLLEYDPAINAEINRLAQAIQTIAPHPRLQARGLALLWLGGDSVVADWLKEHSGARFADLQALHQAALSAQSQHGHDLPTLLTQERHVAADTITQAVQKNSLQVRRAWSKTLGQWAIHPLYSLPILLVILFAVYEFVGVFGATVLVGLLEKDLFEGLLNPQALHGVTWLLTQMMGEGALSQFFIDLLVGQYGLWTMGMTYALALILPIVTTFFIAFGILEDSGYMTRLSIIVNRLFGLMGLNGRAVLPMVLGLGCVTMATLTTRILHSPRERLIAIFLLALAIPCSAQLGVVLGLLGGFSLSAVMIWGAVMLGIFLLTGFLASKLIRGRRIPLVTEMPPMRLPIASNVLKKTLWRLKWYLWEVVPIFLIGTLVMFLADRAGLLPSLIRLGEPLVSGWLGLPPEASAAFVMGFLRRDFGATGLFAIADQLSPVQAVVGMVTITLFIPCFASLLMMVREKGLKTAMAMVAMVVPLAFLVGGVINITLRTLGMH